MLDLTNEEMDLMPEIIVENINYWQDARSDSMVRILHGEFPDVAYQDFLDQSERLRKLESILKKLMENM